MTTMRLIQQSLRRRRYPIQASGPRSWWLDLTGHTTRPRTDLRLYRFCRSAIRIGQNAQAGLYGIVASFFLSYAIMVLGLTHNWLGIVPTAVIASQKLFVICWMVIVTMLVLATLRLPLIFTALFTLVDVTLLLNLLGLIQSSANLTKAAGWVVMAFAALAVYLFFGSASHATGGREFPLGKPILRT
jgi:uncharacterized protein